MLFRFPRLVHLMKADWEESKHPRADDGRFGSGSGGSTSSKKPKPSKTKRKMERRAEAAGQATLGGKAIQTLLGGGSALDKIGWLKAPEKQPEPTKKPEAKPEKKPTPKDRPSYTSQGTTSDNSLKNDLDRGLLRGVRSGTTTETKLRELAATGEISWDHDGNMWQSRRGTARSARDLLHQYEDYTPIKTRLQEFEADYANLQRQAPGKEFPKAREKLDRLRAEYRRMYEAPAPKPKRPLRASPGDLRDIGEIDDRQEEGISTEREPEAPEDRDLRQERYEMGQARVKRLLTQGELSAREAAILRRDLDQGYADLSREPKEPKQEPKAEGKTRISLADQATKLKLKELKELPLSKLRSMQAALERHPKINNPAYPEGKKYDKALRAVEGAIYSKV